MQDTTMQCTLGYMVIQALFLMRQATAMSRCLLPSVPIAGCRQPGRRYQRSVSHHEVLDGRGVFPALIPPYALPRMLLELAHFYPIMGKSCMLAL